jgi:hypothetical protein
MRIEKNQGNGIVVITDILLDLDNTVSVRQITTVHGHKVGGMMSIYVDGAIMLGLEQYRSILLKDHI